MQLQYLGKYGKDGQNSTMAILIPLNDTFHANFESLTQEVNTRDFQVKFGR